MSSPAALAWVNAVGQLGGSTPEAARSAAELEQRYREPHRRYHTLAHVEAVLRDIVWLAEQLGLDADERAVAQLAACAHDVVYDARPGADERASAEWADERLAGCGLALDARRRVHAIVLATIDHRTEPTDLVGQAVLDADLAILAADPGEYARYVAGVRDEYRAVPDADWRGGRAAVLDRLLARPALFATEPGRRRWEPRARDNVAVELAGLREA